MDSARVWRLRVFYFFRVDIRLQKHIIEGGGTSFPI